MRIGPNPDNWLGAIIVAATIAPTFGTPNSSEEVTYGLRPIFTLGSEVKITEGEGTEDNPYTLGV